MKRLLHHQIQGSYTQFGFLQFGKFFEGHHISNPDKGIIFQTLSWGK